MSEEPIVRPETKQRLLGSFNVSPEAHELYGLNSNWKFG